MNEEDDPAVLGLLNPATVNVVADPAVMLMLLESAVTDVVPPLPLVSALVARKVLEPEAVMFIPSPEKSAIPATAALVVVPAKTPVPL